MECVNSNPHAMAVWVLNTPEVQVDGDKSEVIVVIVVIVVDMIVVMIEATRAVVEVDEASGATSKATFNQLFFFFSLFSLCSRLLQSDGGARQRIAAGKGPWTFRWPQSPQWPWWPRLWPLRFPLSATVGQRRWQVINNQQLSRTLCPLTTLLLKRPYLCFIRL